MNPRSQDKRPVALGLSLARVEPNRPAGRKPQNPQKEHPRLAGANPPCCRSDAFDEWPGRNRIGGCCCGRPEVFFRFFRADDADSGRDLEKNRPPATACCAGVRPGCPGAAGLAVAVRTIRHGCVRSVRRLQAVACLRVRGLALSCRTANTAGPLSADDVALPVAAATNRGQRPVLNKL